MYDYLLMGLMLAQKSVELVEGLGRSLEWMLAYVLEKSKGY